MIAEVSSADHGTNGRHQAGPRDQGFNQVWSVSRGIAGPAGLPPDVEATLTAALEMTLNAKEHQQKAEQLSLEPLVMKGDQYRKFLKDNEQSTKKVMGW